MKKGIILAVFLVLLGNICAFSQNSSVSGPVFELSKEKDIPLLVSGAVVCAGGWAANKYLSYPDWDQTKRDSSGVNSFDWYFSQPYSKTLDKTADVLMYTFAVAPAALSFLPDADWKTVCVMYLETVLFSQGLKEGLKAVGQRYRPYTYYDDPDTSYSDGDYVKSWPSGHTTTAFAAAVFASYVYCEYEPDSEYKVPFTAACLAGAASVGVLRVMSGNHFVTDVLSGAVLGSACGFLVPFVHKVNTGLARKSSRDGTAKLQIELYPAGAGIRVG